MRAILLVLSGLAVLAMLMPRWPAHAATSFSCARASTIIGHTAAGRGVRVELLWGVTEQAALDVLLRRFGWEALIGQASALQLYYAVPSRYLLMASKGGCHLAHRYLEEAEAKALMAE